MSALPKHPHAPDALEPQNLAQNGQGASTTEPPIAACGGPVWPDIWRLWLKIPEVLRGRPQWCYSPPGTKAPHDPKTGKGASSTKPSTWATFDLACAAARYTGGCVGYVLSADDPCSVIDLDVKPETPPEHLARFKLIVEMFASYTELSKSGRGLHLVCLGALPDNQGCRRDGVEVYNDARYIICTGNVLPEYNMPPQPRQELLDLLVREIRAQQARTDHTVLIELPATKPDGLVWEALRKHQKHLQIIVLCEGRWQETGHPSASEADLALLSYIANSSMSNEQVRRMFRQTVLGQRQKHVKGNYHIDRALQIIRGRQAAGAAALAGTPLAAAAASFVAEHQAKEKAKEKTKAAEKAYIAELAARLPPLHNLK